MKVKWVVNVFSLVFKAVSHYTALDIWQLTVYILHASKMKFHSSLERKSESVII